MGHLLIRPFAPGDASGVSELICRALREVNSRDYPPEEIACLVLEHAPKDILQMSADAGRMFVAIHEARIAGVLRVLPSWEAKRESWLRTVFVLPSLHSRGIGRRLVQAGEQTAYMDGGIRMRLCASRTAHGFYQKLGYHDLTGIPDADGLYPMEKIL